MKDRKTSFLYKKPKDILELSGDSSIFSYCLPSYFLSFYSGCSHEFYGLVSF